MVLACLLTDDELRRRRNYAEDRVTPKITGTCHQGGPRVLGGVRPVRAWVPAACASIMAVVAGLSCISPAEQTAAMAAPEWMDTVPDLLEENVFATQHDQSAVPDAMAATPALALETHFYVWRFRVREGQVSLSEQLWDHLDESVVAADQAMVLRRNGIRIGVGRGSGWPAVRAVLMMYEPEVFHGEPVVSRGRPISLDLEEVSAGAPIFYFDANDRLVGASHAGGQMCFRIDHQPDVDDIGRLRLRVVPEIRRQTPPRGRRWSALLAPLGRQAVEQFEHLAFSMTLSTGQYFIIGPGSATRMPHLVGSRFLRTEENGTRYENIYCVVPRIYQRRVREHSASRR